MTHAALKLKAKREREKARRMYETAARAYERTASYGGGIDDSAKERKLQRRADQLQRKADKQNSIADRAYRQYEEAEYLKPMRRAGRTNPAKRAILKNFTGTITKNPNGTVSIKGRKK
jgi:transcription initiation factor TFIID subunit TAF12